MRKGTNTMDEIMKEEKVDSDNIIITTHILTIGTISATILFLLLGHNKQITDNVNQSIATVIVILLSFSCIVSAIYAVISAYNHRDIFIANKKSHSMSIYEYISLEIPVIISFTLVSISLLMTYFIIRAEIIKRY